MEKLLPVWGGIECTINRVGDNYYDQLEWAGHYLRENDIETIAKLGISMFRYPILWERYQPKADAVIDWSFARTAVDTLTRHGVEPIIGMVHHGSGPSYVNFFDGSFETGLANYAGQLARAFPDVQYYTPVNEPLTTARFCGLYGHWYPHKTDDLSFCKILLSECRATVMAMDAVRQVNPPAKLVATDDLGKTYSTPLLRYQADFENERRWLSYDLISGRVDREHAMWGYLTECGISAAELEWFLKHNCAIDIVGLNYYITSERYLDEALAHYPVDSHGGNARHQYADVEAVRVQSTHKTGFTTLVTEAWTRFGLPLAITEVHMHCTREEQMRWFIHIYQCSQELMTIGVHISGVTCWAMLGAFGWDKLLRQAGGTYESGAFRLSGDQLLPTGLAYLIRDICAGIKPKHPLLEHAGWWHSDHRFAYPIRDIAHKIKNAQPVRPLLIIGAGGTLGRAIAKACAERNICIEPTTHAELDITNRQQIAAALEKHRPWAVINASGYVRVDDAESDAERCYTINTEGVSNLAYLCAATTTRLVNFSSDLVFDGEKKGYYLESDKTGALNIYGKSKVHAEEALQRIYPDALTIRTSAFFGPDDPYNFAFAVMHTIQEGQPFSAANDVYVSPTYIPDLAHQTLDLLIDGESGIRHVCNEGKITWSEFAMMICAYAGLNKELINAVPMKALANIAERPFNSAMQSEHGVSMPTLENAIKRYMEVSSLLKHIDNQALALSI